MDGQGRAQPVLGFIGIGRMGHPMSSRLVQAGYSLVGFDAAGTLERLPPGAEPADSIEEVAAAADCALLSLPDGNASISVCSALASAKDRRVMTVIDLSTIGMAAARECATVLDQVGVAYVDAPVSGGVAGAREGSLSIVGASAELFERVLPLLQVIGNNSFRLGDMPGQGQAMKLLNNYVAATTLAATSEAIVFGERVGLELGQVLEVLNVSSGRSWSSSIVLPRHVLPRSYDFGFAAALMVKDVRLFLQSAAEAGTSRDVAEAVVALYTQFTADQPGADFSAIHRYLESRSKASAPA